MKKKFKKIVAVILTAAMLVGTVTPAFAEQYNNIGLERSGVEELYYNETDLGHEQLIYFDSGTYYYRNVSPERVLVISDNGIVREVVINELDNWGVLQYNVEWIEGQNTLTTDAEGYTVDYFRDMIAAGYIENLEYTIKNYQTEASSSTWATVDPVVRNSIYEAFEENGEPLESSPAQLIYGKTINGVLTTVYENCEIEMGRETVATTIEKLKPIADVLAVFTLPMPPKVWQWLDVITTVHGAVSVLEEDIKVDRTNVFKREARDGRVGSSSLYTATKTTKWVAETAQTIDTNEIVSWYYHIYTNYSSDLYNDLSGLCDRVYHYYNL